MWLGRRECSVGLVMSMPRRGDWLGPDSDVESGSGVRPDEWGEELASIGP